MVLPEFAIRSGPRRDIYWDASQVHRQPKHENQLKPCQEPGIHMAV